jgi:hypothetical protein
MPIIDGGIDVPVLEWCSIAEAVLWIEFRQPPIDPIWEEAFEDRLPTFGMNERGEGLRSPMTYLGSLGKLYAHLCAGTVSLRGRPAIGPVTISNGLFGRSVYCQKWGDVQLIEAQKIIQAGQDEFNTASINGFLTDTIFFSDHSELAWVYSKLFVNFMQLAERFTPNNGQNIRIGVDMKTVEPTVFADHKDGGTSKVLLKRALRSKKTAPLPQKPRTTSHFDTNCGMRTDEAAIYLGISKSTLEKYRLNGKGPAYKKIGKTCVYFKSDLDIWIALKHIGSTSEKK